MFGPDGSRLFTIPAGLDFLAHLARTLVATLDAKTNPHALSDATIYVPNRRSARALAFALYRELGDQTFFPPQIRPLGDLDDDDPVLASDAALADLGPPPDPARRLGALAKLCASWFESTGRPSDPATALSSARDLSALLDQAALAGGVDWDQLPGLVEDNELAAHWQTSVSFLKIITDHWPDYLKANGLSEPYERRVEVARALAAQWTNHPPKGPVLIAGSTGTTPASRTLMEAALRLDKGAVIFPGLDREASEDAWEIIARTPSHPQHAFATTLEGLGRTPADVALWPDASETDTGAARRRLINEALAPAEATADWLARLDVISGEDTPEDFVKKATDGLSIIEVEDEAEEARLAAVLIRESLTRPEETVALVTPDQALARRVSALLERWSITTTPSAGTSLQQTPAGSFLLLCLRWFTDPGDPVSLAALLKHPLTRVGRSEADLRRASELLEMGLLRGPRRWKSLTDLCATCRSDATDAHQEATRAALRPDLFEPVQNLLDQLDTILASLPVSAPDTPISAIDLAKTLAALMTEIATDDAGVSSHPWANRDGACAARFLESFATACDLLGEMMPDAALAVMEEMALQETVPPDTPGHPRINIWGPLESRLQTADRLIVASLNERQWPEQPGADAFLPRHFRAKLGLPDPDARIGLSAHDFAQIASAPDVILLRSRRRDRRPAVASRWVWRLRTLVQGATPGGDHDLLRPALGIDALELARELVRAEPAPPLAPPRPTPPSETFPERISVTDVSTLIRDPYAIYASKILRLSSLDPVGGDLGGRDYGSAVHSAIEHCLKAGTLAPDHLYNALITALEDAGFTTDQMIERSAVLPLVADGLANILAELAQDMASQRIEEKMTTALRVQKRTITLVGQADLIHRHRDNSATIIDWKTSTYGLTKNNIRAHLEPQLPLLGFLALNELEDIHDIRAMKLVEVRWKGKEALEEVVAPEEDSTGDPLIGASHNGLQSLLSQYLFGGRPFLSRPRPLSVKIYGEYDRLARFAEWGDVLGEDE